MADAPSPLVYDTAFSPKHGQAVEVLPGVVRVTAPNSGPYTFTGTNSFIIGRDRVAVLDPGPADEGHRQALLAAIGGRPVELIVLTHTHKDHSAGAAALRTATGARIWFEGPHRLSRPRRILEVNVLAGDCDWALQPDRRLADGEMLSIGGMDMVAIATPGHCANHMAYGLAGTPWLFTGDHIMGWNSTLVAVPDGSMGAYLDSLRKVIALPYRSYLPAHGGSIKDGPGYASALLAHRLLRNQQIIDAVTAGARTVPQLLAQIYPTLALTLRAAAAMTLKAHIEYLDAQGAIWARRSVLGLRLAPR